MPYQPDVRIMPALMRLHECLCAELTRSGLGENCACALIHGSADSIAPPGVGKGYAWVGLNTIFPSKVFPTPAGDASSCPAPLAALVTVGVMRCYAVRATGETPEEMLLYMDKQMADMAAMRRAIVCCNQEFDDMILGTYTPLGPAGGIYGGQWTVSIGETNA
jgi:hypothetical protein